MSKELYRYKLKKGNDVWDFVSESVPENAEKSKITDNDKFDFCVKETFLKDDAPYMAGTKLTEGQKSNPSTFGFKVGREEKYYNDRYFSEEMGLKEKLSDPVKIRFEDPKKKTSGKEFSSGKFYSVASSSRFAVSSFTEIGKGGKLLDYIETIIINGKEERVSEPEFEHDTPVEGINENSRCPQLDFFFKTANGTYFIEAKNHEILSSHRSIELRPSYLRTAAFKDKEFPFLEGLEFDEKIYVNKNGERTKEKFITVKGNTEKNRFLLASDFGCKLDTYHFDFKQFLCHLMGIWSYAEKHQEENIYFYYLIYRNKRYEENYDKKLYEDLNTEVKTIFEVFGKRFPNIHFGLCYNDKYDTLKELVKAI